MERLQDLRSLFADLEIPERNLDRSILIATWNIREFDSNKYGHRTDESIQYIAEIISRFDLVAVQEVRRSLAALERLMAMLGPHWKYLISDVTEGRQGNGERLAFLYDSRKIRLSGLVGEVVLPPRDGEPADQIARTPYLVGFKAGWAKFALVTAHLLWGSSKADDPRRLAEIAHLSSLLSKRASDKTSWTRNMILLGDFNIFDPADESAQILRENGFVVPESLIEARSNYKRDRAYDQITFHVDRDRIAGGARGGVVDFSDTIYRDEDESLYLSEMGDAYFWNPDGEIRSVAGRHDYYRSWRTHQMSDHYPLWTELHIDYSGRYIERKLNGEA